MNNEPHLPNGNFAGHKSAPRFSAAAVASAQTQKPQSSQLASQTEQTEAVRSLLDQGLSSEAERSSRSLIKTAKRNPALLARAHCYLSVALEMQGRYLESLEALKIYELPEAFKDLDAESVAYVRVHVGLAYHYTGDPPKAIAILNTALREASQSNGAAHLGVIYVALARVYRSINEYTIARDYAQSALDHYRRTGDWRGLAEAYFGIALAELFEGRYEPALENFEQALKLVGDNPAPYLLGKIHTNMAGAFWFLKRMQEGIRCLEKAIGYYERTEHKANAADGYNNLGMNLILIGEWSRAQDALNRALALTSEIDEQNAKVPMVLDSLGQLHMLRGEYTEAQALLERAVSLATAHGNKWYARQALCTLGRCHLGMNAVDEAVKCGDEARALAESIGDRQAQCESCLLLAESYLRNNQVDTCIDLLKRVSEEATESAADVGLIGEAERLNGLVALNQGDATLAAQHFGRSLSIFEMLGDRYRSAIASEVLGAAYARTSPKRALEKLGSALQTFRELGAQPDVARVERSLVELDGEAPDRRTDPVALSQLLTLRLVNAVALRELLLHELAAVLHQESIAERIMIAEAHSDGHVVKVVSYGLSFEESNVLARGLQNLRNDEDCAAYGVKHNASVILLRPQNAQPVVLFIAPRTEELLLDGLSLDPLLRVTTMGLEICALRERVPGAQGGPHPVARADQKIPGLIYSSPAMTRLVDEIHKIRSSDVTVLITGESGTGKELVARAIHQLSSRRSRVFVPFNCTAVPKELSEAHLFGYRRGAFTGAVSDSPGVIRSAVGGTLFLDEIGDLPLDLQPKMLRFLQEGEIQPVGEQRPIKVDVRIIAATNTDLERMVADGRFREDLYYRLNVIRLQVPPLRERRSEIPTIVNHYIEHYSEKFGRCDITITAQAMDLLMVCDWPGNVRQVCNEVQRIIARAEDGTVITPDHLSPELRRMSEHMFTPAGAIAPGAASIDTGAPVFMSDAVEALERKMIVETLRLHDGNVSRTARALGITRRGLQLKLSRYGISANG
ncbi:MAG TPA: sigma 54-interacting transcriptional regulator [Pyrinomonadaceae bacterium]|nr:sigma 54-interacting transcriptional regulator [Pyrinomonadaceae bacterium]